MPIKWRPFKELERPFHLPDIFEEEEWVPFVPAFRAEEPAVDIYQDKDNLYVEVPLVGIKPENVEISIEDNILTIQGRSEEKKEIKEKDYLRKEIKRGAFRRVIKLPVEVKGDKATAESISGMLKITIPKVAKAITKAKRIPIKVK
jgi:HSP20 family protein